MGTGNGERGDDQGPDRDVVVDRAAEVAALRAREPVDVLEGERPVQSHRVAQPRERLGVRLDAEDQRGGIAGKDADDDEDRKSTRLNSSHSQISYAVFCLKKKKKKKTK